MPGWAHQSIFTLRKNVSNLPVLSDLWPPFFSFCYYWYVYPLFFNVRFNLGPLWTFLVPKATALFCSSSLRVHFSPWLFWLFNWSYSHIIFLRIRESTWCRNPQLGGPEFDFGVTSPRQASFTASLSLVCPIFCSAVLILPSLFSEHSSTFHPGDPISQNPPRKFSKFMSIKNELIVDEHDFFWVLEVNMGNSLMDLRWEWWRMFWFTVKQSRHLSWKRGTHFGNRTGEKGGEKKKKKPCTSVGNETKARNF